MKKIFCWKRFSSASRFFKADLNNIFLRDRKDRPNYFSSLKIFTSKFIIRRKTYYARILFEKQRFKLFYNIIKERNFKTFVFSKSVLPLVAFESRLDIFIWRFGFFGKLGNVRYLLRHGYFCLNKRIFRKYNFLLKPGDEISLSLSLISFISKIISGVSDTGVYPRFFPATYGDFSPSTGSIIFFKYPSIKDLFFPFQFSKTLFVDFYKHKN